jgi:hypothetical protein
LVIGDKILVYSLIEGLTALGAFGILIIVNNDIYNFFKRAGLNKDKKITSAYLLYPILGITYLTGFLGHIITNSDFILIKNTQVYISIVLILTIIITHSKLFSDLISNYFEGTIRSKLTAIVTTIWAGLFISFMILPTQKKAFLFLFILILPILLRISPKLKDKVVLSVATLRKLKFFHFIHK